MAEDLYDIRNALILGNHAQVISEGSSIKASPYRKGEENDTMLAERDAIVFKAHIGMGQCDIVIDDLAGTKDLDLAAIRLLARYTKADTQNDEATKAEIVTEAVELAKTAESKLPPSQYVHVVITIASLLIQNLDYEPALKMLRAAQNAITNTQSLALLDVHGLSVDILLRIHRPDLAEKEHKNMSTIDDDATITQMYAAWIGLSQGGEKAKESIQIFEDLREKFGTGVSLLNGMALGHMAQGNYETAEKLLLDAMSKRSSDPETLINLIMCSQHLKKGIDLVNRYINQLKSSSPHHPWVRTYANMETKFTKLASSQM